MARGRKAGRRRVLAASLAVIVAVAVAAIYGPPVAVRLIGGGSYTIPSGAMEPTIMPGDRILALPLGDELPARGTVVIYRHPGKPGIDYVKRLIAFAGETAQMQGGVVHIDGRPAEMQRLADRVVPMRRQGHPPAMPRCRNAPVGTGDNCLQEQWHETLPDGTSQVVLNVSGEIGTEAPGGPFGLDDTPAFTVPAGHVFVLGDHRDNSVDSRFPGHGTVPLRNLRHRVWLIHSSLDRSAGFFRPRWERFFRRVE